MSRPRKPTQPPAPPAPKPKKPSRRKPRKRVPKRTIIRRPTGGITKNTPTVRARIVEATSKGLTRAATAHYAGISEDSLYKWLAIGRTEVDEGNTTTVNARLWLDVHRQEADIAVELTDKVRGAHDWRAAAWLLERRYGLATPAVQAQVVVTGNVDAKHSGQVAHALAFDLSQLTVEQLRALVRPLEPDHGDADLPTRAGDAPPALDAPDDADEGA
jgi:hypothetical protein